MQNAAAVKKHYRRSGWCQDAKRLAIYLRDDFRCAYCGEDLREWNPRKIGLDHLDCHANGGSNEPTNLVTCCIHCNSKRGTKAWREYATGGAVVRIERLIAQPLNMTLAKALLGEWKGQWADR